LANTSPEWNSLAKNIKKMSINAVISVKAIPTATFFVM
jgi:hypothetical protein